MVEFRGFFGGESIMYIPTLIKIMLVDLAQNLANINKIYPYSLKQMTYEVYPYYNMEDFRISNFHPSTYPTHPSMVESQGFFGG